MRVAGDGHEALIVVHESGGDASNPKRTVDIR